MSLTFAPATDAQPATASPTADAPPPALCAVPPRPLSEINALLATPPAHPAPSPTPGVLPAGAPADPAAIAGVTTTIRELVACYNAGELLNSYSLYTDRYFQQVFAAQGSFTASAYSSLATPEPSAAGDRAAILAITGVRLLDDGRVGAVVTLHYPNVPIAKTFFFTFVRAGERWLIDNILGELGFSVP